ncbi:MAG: RNA polymerase sigma factor RpoH [Parvularcula sp.]|nr:RNA polymerase sigma factor RpoH [Parvularcula sp.]
MSNALTTTGAALTPEGSLSRYLAEIRKFPMLEKDEEYMLAKRFAEHEDPDAAQRLITSHLRLVAKIAMGYRGYGLPIGEVISEGNVGLMQAVKRFDPDKGFRLATYAMWWIRASIQEYILRSWSLVKIGTTAAQKKLFFNLRKLKGQIDAVDEGDLNPEQVEHIAKKLGVTNDDVISMNRRMSGGEASLNAPMGKDAEGGGEWQDWLVDENAVNPETQLANEDEYEMRMGLLEQALSTLNEREQHILTERRLKDNPSTLEELSQEYGVSRERVRQIEVRAFEKLQKAMKRMDRDAKQATTEASEAHSA